MDEVEVQTGMCECEGGHAIAYEVFGDGDQVVVYLHGLLMDSGMNRPLARALAARGQRVVLIDVLGHGRSDKPLHASAYRMDAYARMVLAVLDHLGIERAIVGGISLGANISLELAVHDPERVQALLLEMPVLEWAVPAAAMIFTPLLLTMHYAAGPAGFVADLVGRLPDTGNDALDSALRAGANRPEVVKAVLHGILTGPVAPTVEQRAAIEVPTLVLAHTRDVIHPFSDAENLAELLPDARLLPTRSLLELRVRPERLMAEITAFVDDAWVGATT